jgi:uncharacterized protein YndB with AHSA1/START domain
MSNSLVVINDIIIDAPAAKVWDALVNPAKTKQYMFGCETVSDWKKGSTLEWRGNFDGIDLVAVTGTIVDIQPGKYLAYTAIDPNNPAIRDTLERCITVTYSLEENKGQTTFTVTQGDYAKVEDGERRYKEAYNDGIGWDPILVEIKKLVESN